MNHKVCEPRNRFVNVHSISHLWRSFQGYRCPLLFIVIIKFFISECHGLERK